ncbi:MAG TPA: hypothetical protein VF788_01890 [Pseudonocardiaceae bacterium]
MVLGSVIFFDIRAAVEHAIAAWWIGIDSKAASRPPWVALI